MDGIGRREIQKRVKCQKRAEKCPTNRLKTIPQKVMDLAKSHFIS